MAVRILVVDDEPSVTDLLAYNLRKASYEVLTAADGRAALDLARQDKPDLILLDLMLPEMDGLDLCRELRKTSNVPVIMITARGEEIDRVVGLELGADDYVTKPFSVRELMARIKAVLRRAQPAEDETPGALLHGPGGLQLDVEQRARQRGRAARRADQTGIRPAIHVAARGRACADAPAPVGTGLGLYLRGRYPRRGQRRQTPARQITPGRPRSGRHRSGARCGLQNNLTEINRIARMNRIFRILNVILEILSILFKSNARPR